MIGLIIIGCFVVALSLLLFAIIMKFFEVSYLNGQRKRKAKRIVEKAKLIATRAERAAAEARKKKEAKDA